MRLLAATLLTATLLAPAIAHAGRFTAGVSLGRTQTEVDADADFDASSTAALWLRLGLGRHAAVDLEYGKISTEDEAARARSLDLVGRLVIANLHGGTIHPMGLLAVGIDTAANDARYHHTAIGAAVEIDIAKNFVVGVDFRLGERVDDTKPLFVDNPAALRLRDSLSDGSFRASHLYLGVRL